MNAEEVRAGKRYVFWGEPVCVMRLGEYNPSLPIFGEPEEAFGEDKRVVIFHRGDPLKVTIAPLVAFARDAEASPPPSP